MDDLSEKLSSILNDPKAMQDVAALAQSLGVDSSGLHKPEPKPEPKADSLLPEMSTLVTSLAPMLSKVKGEDDTTRLLEAMRPFLSEERREKLDKAKRLIKVMKLMPLIKELDLLDL